MGSAETEAVLGHHMESFAATDVDAIMSDFTEDSVLITGDQTLKGVAEIKTFFTGMFPMVTPEFLAAFKMVKQEIVDEVAYINWTVPGFIALGTDTLIVKNGKIAIQTFAAHPAG